MVNVADLAHRRHRRGESGTWSCEVGTRGGNVTIHGSVISVEGVYG